MRTDLTRLILSVAAIVGLIGGTLWVLSPFFAAIVWATMIAVATWPLMLRVQSWLGGRRALAVAAMTILMLLVFMVPVALAVATIIENADNIARWARALATLELPPAPAWVKALPLVGGLLVEGWNGLRALETGHLVKMASPFAGDAARWLGEGAGKTGLLLVHLLLTVVITAVLYAQGEQAARSVLALARRLGAERAERAVRLAASAIRAVALGVVLTALIQAAVAGIGLAIAGIALAALLTAVTFILCIAQIGAWPVLIPAVIWLYWDGQTGWGTFLLVWSIVVLTMDNVIRPLLIRSGADLPLLLIFAGVIGGLLSMGFVGLFVGPVLLAVTFMLFEAWTGLSDEPLPPARPAERPGARAAEGASEAR
jgi:predicted PurR-regulated permease PerM